LDFRSPPEHYCAVALLDQEGGIFRGPVARDAPAPDGLRDPTLEPVDDHAPTARILVGPLDE